MIKTIIARKPSRCYRCGQLIVRGDHIRWLPGAGAGGGTWHLRKDCQPPEVRIYRIGDSRA